MTDERGSKSDRAASAFLRLPLTVRERIYALAGLVRSCPVNIEEEHDRWLNISRAYKSQDSELSDIFPSNIPQADLARWQDHKCVHEIPSRWGLLLPIGAGCIHPSLPIQLLRVSKQIYLEAMRVLYSQN